MRGHDHEGEPERIWPDREQRRQFWEEMRSALRGDPPTPEQRERMDEIEEAQRRNAERERERWEQNRPRCGGQHTGDWRPGAER